MRQGLAQMRFPVLCTVLAVGLSGPSAPREQTFKDPMFQRCVLWMLDGQRGSLIDNVCLQEYGIPPPSLFSCARKVQTGFLSETDQEVCAIIFEEEVKKVRGGYVR